MKHDINSADTAELLSALADGQLHPDEVALVLRACRQDGASAHARWNTYHLIGDVLRSPVAASQGADARFIEQFGQRLARELAVEPVPSTRLSVPVQLAEPGFLDSPATRDAANDGSFRWKLLAGVASLAAVAAIAWNATGLLAPAAAPQLAQAPQPQPVVVVASPQGPMVRDARLEELLAAHRQLGGVSALQAPSGFLRNATFETTQDARR